MDVRIAVTPHQRQTFEPVTLGQIRATKPLFSAFFSRGGHVMSVFYALRRLPLSASALIEDALAGAPSGESVLVIDVGGTSVKTPWRVAHPPPCLVTQAIHNGLSQRPSSSSQSDVVPTMVGPPKADHS
jgi:hypothetical protein